MPLSPSVFSQSGPPICTPIWAFFRAFKALRALKGPLIKFSHILMHRPYRDILNLKFSCLYLFPLSHKVVPQKASGGGGGVVGGGDGSSGRPGSKFCPGRDRAGMTLIPAGTGIDMKSRPGPGLASSRPGPGPGPGFFH